MRRQSARIRFHDQHHTCAALLLKAHVDAKVVADLLGHASVAITLDIYSHVLPDMLRDAVAAITATLDTPVPPAEMSGTPGTRGRGGRGGAYSTDRVPALRHGDHWGSVPRIEQRVLGVAASQTDEQATDED